MNAAVVARYPVTQASPRSSDPGVRGTTHVGDADWWGFSRFGGLAGRLGERDRGLARCQGAEAAAVPAPESRYPVHRLAPRRAARGGAVLPPPFHLCNDQSILPQ